MKKLAAAVLFGFALSAAAAPVSYTLDPDHTVPRFEILHNGFSNHMGMFVKSAGKAVLDTDARTGSVEVTIETASFLSGHALMEKVVGGSGWCFVASNSPSINGRCGESIRRVVGRRSAFAVRHPLAHPEYRGGRSWSRRSRLSSSNRNL